MGREGQALEIGASYSVGGLGKVISREASNLKIGYTSYNKPVEPPRDWYWQVIYYLRPQDCPQDGGPNVGVFEEELAKGMVTAYVVGGASRALLEATGVTRRDQDDAFYQAITPICDGLDYWGMVTAMFGINRPM